MNNLSLQNQGKKERESWVYAAAGLGVGLVLGASGALAFLLIGKFA